MAITKIHKTDNGVVWWPFLDRDGNALDLTSDQVITTAELVQNNRVVAGPFILGVDGVLRTKDADTHTLEYEYTTAVTSLLSKMVTILRVTIIAPNDLLEVDDNQSKIFEAEIFQVI